MPRAHAVRSAPPLDSCPLRPYSSHHHPSPPLTLSLTLSPGSESCSRWPSHAGHHTLAIAARARWAQPSFTVLRTRRPPRPTRHRVRGSRACSRARSRLPPARVQPLLPARERYTIVYSQYSEHTRTESVQSGYRTVCIYNRTTVRRFYKSAYRRKVTWLSSPQRWRARR